MIPLIYRAEVWTLTWQGWLMVAIALTILSVVGVRWLYPFLSVSRPIDAEVAIVEGWIPDDVLKTLIPDLKPYRLILTTGYPVQYGRYLSGYENFAQVATDTLIYFGLSPDSVVAIPCKHVERNRTLASAIAVHEWLRQNEAAIQSVNLYSLGPHTRRSWLMFRRTLAPLKVGIIAAQPHDYDPRCWFTSSSGTRAVMAEGISYLYAVWISWKR